MIRRRVIGFFIWLFVLAGVFLALSFAAFSGITGKTVGFSEIGSDKYVRLYVEEAYIKDGFVSVKYILFFDEPGSGNIEYIISSKSGDILKRGEESVVGDAGKSEYSLKVFVPTEEDVFLTMSFFDGKNIYYEDVPIKRYEFSISGLIVKESNFRGVVPYIGFLIFGMFILIYYIWYSNYNRRVGYVAQGVRGRYIKLRDLY